MTKSMPMSVTAASRSKFLKAVVDRVTRQFAQGHLDGADVLLTTVVNEPGLAAYAHHMRGLIALRRGEIDQARQLLIAAIEIEPTNAEAHANLGAILIEAGQCAAAVAAYEAALTLQPRRVAALIGLAKALAAIGEAELAIDCYRDVIDLEPDHEVATASLAALLDDSSDGDRRPPPQISEGERSVLCDALFVQGVRHHRDRNIARSINSFERVLTLDPDHVNTLCNLGSLERDRGRHARAVPLLRHAVGLAPEFSAARLALGDALLACDYGDDAMTHYRKALQLSPHSDAVHVALALAFRSSGNFEAAISHFEQAVQLNQRQSAAFYLALGQTLIAMGRLPGAVISLRHAIHLDPALTPATEALQSLDAMIADAPARPAAVQAGA